MNQLFYAVNVYIYNNRMLLRVIMSYSYEHCNTRFNSLFTSGSYVCIARDGMLDVLVCRLLKFLLTMLHDCIHADIPPLEDMTEYLNKLGFGVPSKPSVVEEPVQTSSLPSAKKGTSSSGGGSSVTGVQTVQSATKDSDSAKKSSESAMFGGLRKGFLLSTSTSKSSSSAAAKAKSKDATSSETSVKEPHSKAKTDEQVPSSKAGKSSSAKAKKAKRTEKGASSSQDVPLLTAQSGAGKQDGLVIEEVQDALKKGTQHLMEDTGTVSMP